MQMQMQQHLSSSVQNATRAAADWAASPVGRLVRVEVLVTLSCALLTMLVFLGSGRRYSRSAAFRAVVWSALMLSYPAVSYTIGLMQSASFRNELMVVWACFLLGCADGIAACSVDDSDQQARLLLNQAAQTIYVLLLLLSYAGSLRRELKILLFLFWALTVAKLSLRLQRLLSVGRDRVLTVDNGLVTKYMRDEYRLSEWRWQEYYAPTDNSGSMDHYKYVVTGEENLQDDLGEYRLPDKNDDLVTLDKVWQCGGWLLRTGGWGGSHELKNLCLSFALFKLLRRRLNGSPQYELQESIVRKLRDFFCKRIVDNGGGNNNPEAMYRVIEMELGFLFDFFYARYPSHKQSLIPETSVFTTALALSMSSLLSPMLMHYGAAANNGGSVIATRFDIWLTRLVIFLFLSLETFQYLKLVLSDWYKVKLICRYVKAKATQGQWSSCFELNPFLAWALLCMCRLTLTRRYWSNAVGQYSLLHACIQQPESRSSRLWPPNWVRTTHRHRDLPKSAKDAVTRELQRSIRQIVVHSVINRKTVVYYSPERFYLQLGASGRGIAPPKPTIRTILVWHIATTIRGGRKPPEVAVAAATLSAYCAYLVCHAPELITDNMYETQLLLEGVQRRARQYLRGCRSEDAMYSKLSNVVRPEEEDNDHEAVLAQGVMLSELLTRKFPDEGQLWGLLAQVWAKFLLSGVAPYNNVGAHIKRLASGGEFVTHLWALMTQGGFVEQPWISRGDRPEDPEAAPGPLDILPGDITEEQIEELQQQDHDEEEQRRNKPRHLPGADIDAWMQMLERQVPADPPLASALASTTPDADVAATKMEEGTTTCSTDKI